MYVCNSSVGNATKNKVKDSGTNASHVTQLVTISHCIGIHNVNLYSCNFAVCREWLVHEDGALAYRLQDEESM